VAVTTCSPHLALSGKFFQLVGGPLNAALSGPEAYKITSWVKQACRMIPAQDYRGAPGVGARPSLTGRGPVALYQCGRGS
jgi:hypothetical protein